MSASNDSACQEMPETHANEAVKSKLTDLIAGAQNGGAGRFQNLHYMQLVPTDIHDATRHTGGIAVLKKAAVIAGTTVSIIASDIANADTGDWIGFTADMVTPLGLEMEDLGGGTDMIDPNNPPPLWEGYFRQIGNRQSE